MCLQNREQKSHVKRVVCVFADEIVWHVCREKEGRGEGIV